jgi:hypothetical protein
VSVDGGNAESAPSIAMDDDGDFVVAWQGQDANNSGVFARRYNSGGGAQGIFQVNTTSSGEQWRPDVAMDAAGNFVVAWDGEGASDSKGIYARRFDALGTALGGQFGVNGAAFASRDQESASVAMSGGGRFVVTWQGKDQDNGSSFGVFGQEFTSSGSPDGGEFQVNTYTSNDQESPAVAMADGGSYVVAWSGEGPGDTNGVFWRRFAAPATGTISGTIYNDANGDASVGTEGTFANAIVNLYRDDGVLPGAIDTSDTWVASTATDGGGNYSFGGLAIGTYYVTVDSRTLGAANVWAEQTYGVAGSALGAGFTAASGALYGGRSAALSDNAGALTSSEHVAQVSLAGGPNAAGVDFGFSFNAITSSRDGDDDTGAGGADRWVQGSLRQFIQNANVTTGLQSANFSINYAGGGGLQTITLANGMPALTITDAVMLDAGTQEGVGSTPRIELSGASAGAVSGLTLGGTGGSAVRGFAINRFSGSGIVVAPGSDGNSILASYIGTDAAGATAAGNGAYGIEVSGSGNTIGAGNVISGNFVGVLINGPGATGNRVAGRRPDLRGRAEQHRRWDRRARGQPDLRQQQRRRGDQRAWHCGQLRSEQPDRDQRLAPEQRCRGDDQRRRRQQHRRRPERRQHDRP